MLVSKPNERKMREVHSIRERISVNCCHSIAYGLVWSHDKFWRSIYGYDNDKSVISCCCYTQTLNKIGRNYTLTIRNRSRRYFTLHIFTHCLLSFRRSRCKGYVRFSRIWNYIRRTNIDTEMKMMSTEEIQILNKDMIVAVGIAI